MKRNKLRLATKILAIIIVCLVSFVGIYVQKLNRMENIVKGYSLSKDLKGYREIIFKISDANKVLDADGKVVGDTDSYDDESIDSNGYTKSEEKVNSDDKRNVENYKNTVSIIEKRLKDIGVEEYNLSLDKQTGDLYLQIPEDKNTDRVVSNITETGSIELKDSEDGTVYLTNNNLKQAKTLYNTTESGTVVYLELIFNKEGKEILKDLSENEYAKLPEEDEKESSEESTEEDSTDENATDENTTDDNQTEENKNEETSENEEEQTQKEITLSMSGSDVLTTSFDEPIVDGKIDLTMNQASTDSETISDALQSTSTIELLLNNGALPLTYNVEENQYVETDISAELIKNVMIVIAVIIGVLLVYMIIKHKVRGLLAVISYIGFIAIYLLLLRYTNVTISLEGIVAGVIIAILNYLFSMKLLTIEPDEKKKYNKEYLQLLINLIPIFAISIIFCFMKLTILTSFGMVMFWGIVLMAIYNILITKHIVD